MAKLSEGLIVKKKALMLSTMLGALALAPAAFAEPNSGWYGAFDLGYHWADNMDMRSEGLASDGAPYNFEFEVEDDFVGFARLGYRINPNWRVELEGGARAGSVGDVYGDPTRPTPNALCEIGSFPPCTPPQGSIKSYTVMANVIYDFMPDSSFNPFIGVGVGVNRVDVSVGGQGNQVLPVSRLGIDQDDTSFAWQALAGFSFVATDRLNIDATYRFLQGSDVHFDSTGLGTFAAFDAWRVQR